MATSFRSPHQAAITPITIQWKLYFRKLLVSIRSWVGVGSFAPKSANIAANTGMTKMSSTLTRMMARLMTAIG